ncbi:MAG: hypothetical protein A2785_02630 [Candidatus Chisholmbacteria bacterium RIFCSPHIGHO2_01_FULL_49_18]|uniref:Uncharacterized protein n=1 Tax=Candidatus Chisholmbacteria bacterium RIFCSPHIGHO2_01_FULL_49_18 TaxID=1797590 RepID=A0A1G1VL06_9BACT|nr:MAG: hypothetical protein A2785_02630 [Candidatus Chisholmbacteria bacterium RIFCSPHIGHO2_01_FULL_49_18]
MNIGQRIKRSTKMLTTIDLIAIIGVLLFLLGFYIFFRRETRTITIRLKVTDENVLYADTQPRSEYAHSFQIGDVEKDELGRTIAEIVNVDMYDYDEKTKVVYLDVALKTLYNPRKQAYSLRGKKITFGETFTFDFNKVHANALVIDSPDLNREGDIKSGKIIVRAQFRQEFKEFSDVYGVPEYIANAIKPGEEVTDSNGRVLAKVISVEVFPATRTSETSSGQIIAAKDPVLKDVFCTIELTTREVNGDIYMFDYVPVKIGQKIPLNLQHLSVFPTIIEIIE